MKLELIENPEQEIYKAIQTGIRHYNRQFLAMKEEELPLACVVRNDEGEIVGGINACIFTTSLFIEHLWVSEACRAQKLGSQLIEFVLAEAQKRGATDAFLDTYSFQAREFYLKLGFTEVGQYTDYPSKGVHKHFFQKKIA